MSASNPYTAEPKPEDRIYVQGENITYVLPNDAPEHTRLETQAAHLKANMDNNVIHSPLSDPRRILDVGCGTGSVTRDLATLFPQAKVYGLDLAPVPQISDQILPSNIEYVQGNIMELDVENPGHETIAGGGFDLIYSRLLICGMTNWTDYIPKTFNLLNRGTGWLEVQDIAAGWYDDSDNLISADWEWVNVICEAATERGLDFSCGKEAAKWMQDAGFDDVKTTVYRWPFGSESEKTPETRAWGDFVAIQIPQLFEHVISKITETKKYHKETVEKWRAEMRANLKPAQGKHLKFFVTRGRRPAA